MKKLDRKEENLLSKIIYSKCFNNLCFILGIIVIFLYFGFYMIKQPIVDEEVRPEVTNNLIPWEIKNNDNILKSIIEKPFDLKITEYGQYRPRYLAFLTQFIDENLFLNITRLIPFFGNRQPFYILAAFLTVFSLYYFFRSICKSYPKGLAFFLSSSILLFQNYQVATYWRARSAKLLALSACIFLLTYVIKNLNIDFKKENLKNLFLSIPIFLLMTLDEQVLALVAFLTLLTYIFSLMNKKVSLISIITTISCFLYATFHLWWGKALFNHFTGSIQKHGHTISGSLSGISLESLYDSVKILKNVIPKTIFLSFFIFLVIWLIFFIHLIIKKEKNKREKIKQIIIILFLTSSSIVLLMLMIDAHPAIYSTKCLWMSVYIIIPVILLLLSLFYLIEVSKLKKCDFVKYYMTFVGVLVAVIFNTLKINSTYYGAYLDIKGGFSSSFSDLIITKNDIKTDIILTKNFNIDNDNLVAILNTPFSTSNIKTTKILKGYKKDKIYNGFEGYFITQNKRKLHIDFDVLNIGKNETVIIYVNNDKKLIKLDNKKIVEDIDISTERNRSCKIRILIKGTNKNIKVNEMYMK